MYLPSAFREQDPAALQRLIHAAPLGTLVLCNEAGLQAHHLPFVLDQAGGTLQAHVPRANPLSTLSQPQACLVIFHGADGYISPSWYASKPRHGKVVPTWNYAVVHAHGQLRLVDDSGWVRQQVDTLTRQQEQRFSQPWSLADAPAEFIDRLLASLVGLEIRIDRLEGKTKASQNQPQENQRSVLAALADDDAAGGLLAMMQAALKPAGS
ncbi:MAG: FMN-binding negative transcriptional regulator [Alcanivorax sp.]|nr:FMN-binding negative transcriptional regulator [Alcanivorax sp.]